MDFTRKISKAIGNPMHFLGKFIEEKEALNFEAHYLAPVFLHQVRAFMRHWFTVVFVLFCIHTPDNLFPRPIVN
jgi:hypothetical protein